MLNSVEARIRGAGIVPVIKLDKVEDARPLGEALVDGGICVAEVTFRSEAAAEGIREMSSNADMLVGAGTVLTLDQLDAALEAGAQFIVSPGFNPKIVKACMERGVSIFPGCSSPTDIEQALELGLRTVKFFPAESLGGLDTIKALSGPYGDISFIPTGGISPKNIGQYIRYPKVVACGGSWMVSAQAIAAGDFFSVTAATKASVKELLGFGIEHVGINCTDQDELERTIGLFCVLFDMEQDERASVTFADTLIECGTGLVQGKPHIAIGTNSAECAYHHLLRRGAKFLEETKKVDENGRLRAIYLAEDFGGMAVHILQR